MRFISDRVIVMYLGEVVESGPVDALWSDARHPYTRALLAAMPSLDPDRRTQEAPITGDPPNPIDPPSGCRFHTRCPFAEGICSATSPALFATGNPRHAAACHMVDPASGHSRAGMPLPGRLNMPDVLPERIAALAAAARVPLADDAAARIARAVTPTVDALCRREHRARDGSRAGDVRRRAA